MMQQMTMSRTQPLVLGGLSRGARWAALAFASIAVPASIVLGALVAEPTASNSLTSMAPVAIEVAPIAAVSEPAAVPPIPAAPASDDGATPRPQYSFVWTEECESSCPGRGEF